MTLVCWLVNTTQTPRSKTGLDGPTAKMAHDAQKSPLISVLIRTLTAPYRIV